MRLLVDISGNPIKARSKSKAEQRFEALKTALKYMEVMGT